jgi:hypothetical protein
VEEFCEFAGGEAVFAAGFAAGLATFFLGGGMQATGAGGGGGGAGGTTFSAACKWMTRAS